MATRGLIALAGSVVNGVAAFGVVIAVTRGLSSAASSGAVFAAVAVFNITYLVSTLGAEVAVVRFVARGDRREAGIARTAMAPAIVFSVTATLALLALRNPLASAIAGESSESAASALLAVLPFIPAATTTTVLMAITRGRGEMTPTALVERISRPGAQLVMLSVLAVTDASVGLTSLAWAVPFGLALVPAARFHRRSRPIDDARPDDVAREYWGFAAPQALTTVFQVVLRWADIVLVAALADPATAAVYTAASRLLLAGNFVNLAIVQAISPMISSALGRGERAEARDLLRTGTAWLVLAVWPGYLLLIAFGAPAMGIFGAGYADGAAALAILSAAMLVASAVGPIEAVLLMSGGSRLSLADNAAAVTVNIALNVLLIPRFGLEGAAIAWAVGLLITNLAPLVQVRRRLGIDPFGRATVTAAALATALVGLPGIIAGRLFGVGLVPAVMVGVVLIAAHLTGAVRMNRSLHLDELRQALRRRPAPSHGEGKPEPAKAGSVASST